MDVAGEIPPRVEVTVQTARHERAAFGLPWTTNHPALLEAASSHSNDGWCRTGHGGTPKETAGQNPEPETMREADCQTP